MTITDEAIAVAREHLAWAHRNRVSVPDQLAMIGVRMPLFAGQDDLVEVIACAWMGVAYAGLSPREADYAALQLQLWREAA